jgi:hypothetical protein
MRERRLVRALAALLHIKKLKAQRRDAVLRKTRCDRCHEWMLHPGAGTMRENVTGHCVARGDQQPADALRAPDLDADRFWCWRRHEDSAVVVAGHAFVPHSERCVTSPA